MTWMLRQKGLLRVITALTLIAFVPGSVQAWHFLPDYGKQRVTYEFADGSELTVTYPLDESERALLAGARARQINQRDSQSFTPALQTLSAGEMAQVSVPLPAAVPAAHEPVELERRGPEAYAGEPIVLARNFEEELWASAEESPDEGPRCCGFVT